MDENFKSFERKATLPALQFHYLAGSGTSNAQQFCDWYNNVSQFVDDFESGAGASKMLSENHGRCCSYTHSSMLALIMSVRSAVFKVSVGLYSTDLSVRGRGPYAITTASDTSF